MTLVFSAFVCALLLGTPALAQVNGSTDLTKPTISSVTVSNITSTRAEVTWSTNEPATSYVDFGTSDLYGTTAGEGSYLTAHVVTVSGLTANTIYHFRIRSKDAAGNEATSTDTTFTSAATAVTNTNTAVNSNGNVNTKVNTNTAVNANANKNTNTAVNKNTNTKVNTNANKNVNTNANANKNVNKAADETNVNSANLNTNTVNENANDALDLNASADTTNTTNTADTGTTSDGRTGVLLIVLGLLLLVGVLVTLWVKSRRERGPRP
ncbi:MAG: fibronectin type III domain-containing protein [Patescibacteria group bacterium]